MAHDHSHSEEREPSSPAGHRRSRRGDHDPGHRERDPHGHGHAHGHGHDHDHGQAASERRLAVALGILLTFTAVEALGGWFANSIALLAEAAHMLADSGALLLAIVAIRASRRPADARHTYGSSRYQTLAAYTNGLALLALTAWVAGEAVRRLIAPPAVDGRLMLIIAVIGGAANLAAFLTLSGASSLNERGARAHVFSDLLGSAAAAAAAGVILDLGWRAADPILSILVSLLILRSGWRLTRDAGHVLLQGAPQTLNPDGVARDLEQVPGVRDVHHLHVWSMTGEAPVVTLHAIIDSAADPQAVLQGILGRLRHQHAITHATIQLESIACLDGHEHGCHRA